MFKKRHKIWELPTRQFQAVMPARTDSLGRRIWSMIAMIGAIVVVSLYLIVPLMIFFSGVNDLVTRLLSILLILTIAEFFIFNILSNTARATRRDATKAQSALINSQDRGNIPFDIIVGAETRKAAIPPLQNEDPDATEKAPILLHDDDPDATEIAPVLQFQDNDMDMTRKVPVPQIHEDAETQQPALPESFEHRTV